MGPMLRLGPGRRQFSRDGRRDPGPLRRRSSSCSRSWTGAGAWAASPTTWPTCSARRTPTTARGSIRTLWPTVGDGSYDANAREIDDFVWNHRDLVVCFAAGNSGQDASQTGHIDPGSVGAPSTAKNCITVGATQNLRPTIAIHYDIFGFPVNPLGSDLVADNPEGMAAFSGRGPTTDGRIKPDVVAPGTAVLRRDRGPWSPPAPTGGSRTTPPSSSTAGPAWPPRSSPDARHWSASSSSPTTRFQPERPRQAS